MANEYKFEIERVQREMNNLKKMYYDQKKTGNTANSNTNNGKKISVKKNQKAKESVNGSSVTAKDENPLELALGNLISN